MSDPETEPKHETTRLGSYTIVRKLARGGMAELFLARSVGPEGFEKLVVLKKILPRYAENPRFVQLFLDEAKLAASLDHPHIAHVYDMGRVDGHYFFTMEYVHGQDARSILRRTERGQRKTPIELAVQIIRNVASALHYAHERRRPDGTLRDIVHRDVSPSNILVSYDGAIKLADFGVAKASSSSVRTRTGTLKGKVGYMSPEQARGAQIDRRSDIFSLGVVLWELVAIRRLFKCDNDLATIQAIINMDPPPLAEGRDDCPPELDRIVKRALAKDVANRYQTAQELQRDLEELAREHKLDQSSIALSTYIGELFEPELTAVRNAQASGITVTEIVASSDLTTPVSESDLSLSDPSFAPEPPDDEPSPIDDLDDDDVEEDVGAGPIVLPPVLPPLAGTISRDEPEPDLDEKTDFGPPPVMLDSQITQIRRDPEPFEAASTAVHDNPFADNLATALDTEHLALAKTAIQTNPTLDTDLVVGKTAVRANPFGDELPTVQARVFPDENPTMPIARHTPPAGVAMPPIYGADLIQPHAPPPALPISPAPMHRAPPTPPTGVAVPNLAHASQPMLPQPFHGDMQVHPTPPGQPAQPYPMVSSMHGQHGAHPSQPPAAFEGVNLTPHRKMMMLLGIVIVLLVFIIILGVVASRSTPTEDKPVAVPVDATVEAPKPREPEPVKPPPPAVKPKPRSPAPVKAPPPPEPPPDAAVEEPEPTPAPPPVRRPAKPFKPPRR